MYGSRPTHVMLNFDEGSWPPSVTVQEIGLWDALAPGAAKSKDRAIVELSYVSVMR
jgi:hypothetical protein